MLFYLDNWQSAHPRRADHGRAEARRQCRRAEARPGAAPVRPGARRPDARPAAGATRPAGGAESPAARPQRELRPRADGAAHARRRRRLHAEGRAPRSRARSPAGRFENPRQGGGFVFEPRLHDDGEKIVLGHTIKAGGGERDGEQVLDILATHPSTARFIATKLARRFVADTPPPALVDRAAARFRDTDGDLREVVRTILTSPEFFAAEAYRAKVKTPFEFVVSAVRATGADVHERAAARRARCASSACRSTVPAADRLRRPRRRLGQHRRAAQPHELRAGADRAVAIAAAVRTPAPCQRILRPRRDALVAGVLGGDLSASTTATIAKAHAGAAGHRARCSARRNSREGRIQHDLATHLPQERRARARQPRLRAGVPRAHGGRGRRAAPKVLIAIFQRGAVDGLNMIVPFGETRLLRARGRASRLPRPDAAPTRPSISTASSACIRGSRRSSRSATRASSPSSTPADRPTARARTSTRRTTWRRRRPA